MTVANHFPYSCSDCAATSKTSNDGSDGNFYCINGGVVGGFAPTCLCTSCNPGFGGSNCATCAAGYSGTDCSADHCVATSTSIDDSSDGNFYCINGGSIGGTTGTCTCTSCNIGSEGLNCAICSVGYAGSDCSAFAAGYSGSDCSADPCVATSTSIDDGSDGNFYCINGGKAGRTTGVCTCTCATDYAGTNCQRNGNTLSVTDSTSLYTAISCWANGETVKLAGTTAYWGQTIKLSSKTWLN